VIQEVADDFQLGIVAASQDRGEVLAVVLVVGR